MKATAYLLQATIVAGWWLSLWMYPSLYDHFLFPGFSRVAFDSFMVPDLLIITLLSVVRAYTRHSVLDYVILGGFAFATLYCINASFLTKGGYLSSLLMILGTCYNLFLIFDDQLFRVSSTRNVWINGLKTVVQIICVWPITLLVIPALIVSAFGNEPIVETAISPVGGSLFCLFSILGIYSAYAMVLQGQGTPLPLDQTQELVTSGPYRYVRNPMAISGIGQGLSLALMIGSWPIAVYALLGALLWHTVVRPVEEKDMLERFGVAYDQYRKEVRCWVPRVGDNQ